MTDIEEARRATPTVHATCNGAPIRSVVAHSSGKNMVRVTAVVQFDVNIPAPSKVIFIDQNNAGTIEISIDGGFRISEKPQYFLIEQDRPGVFDGLSIVPEPSDPVHNATNRATYVVGLESQSLSQGVAMIQFVVNYLLAG